MAHYRRGGGRILKEGAFARSASLSRLLLGTFLAETGKVPPPQVCNVTKNTVLFFAPSEFAETTNQFAVLYCRALTGPAGPCKRATGRSPTLSESQSPLRGGIKESLLQQKIQRIHQVAQVFLQLAETLLFGSACKTWVSELTHEISLPFSMVLVML